MICLILPFLIKSSYIEFTDSSTTSCSSLSSDSCISHTPKRISVSCEDDPLEYYGYEVEISEGETIDVVMIDEVDVEDDCLLQNIDIKKLYCYESIDDSYEEEDGLLQNIKMKKLYCYESIDDIYEDLN